MITFAMRDGPGFEAIARKLGATPEASEIHARDPFGLELAFRRI